MTTAPIACPAHSSLLQTESVEERTAQTSAFQSSSAQLPHNRHGFHRHFRRPCGSLGKQRTLSAFSALISQSPLLHSHVFENLHPRQTRFNPEFPFDSHFSYEPTTAACFSISFYSHNRPRAAAHCRMRKTAAAPIALRGAQLDPAWQTPKFLPTDSVLRKPLASKPRHWQVDSPIRRQNTHGIQKTIPVFHAHLLPRIATIGRKRGSRFPMSASCCTLRA